MSCFSQGKQLSGKKADNWLISVYHQHLSPTCKDTSENVPYMQTLKEHLQEPHLYSWRTAKRPASLESAAEVLWVSELKVTVCVSLTRTRRTPIGSQHEAMKTLSEISLLQRKPWQREQRFVNVPPLRDCAHSLLRFFSWLPSTCKQLFFLTSRASLSHVPVKEKVKHSP